MRKSTIFFCLLTFIIFLVFTSEGYAINHGFYIGLGAAANTIDETFSSTLITSENKSGEDNYTVSTNRFSPMAQLGYTKFLNEKWLLGIVGQWKYLNYKTSNVDSSQGQHLPNATFSSINIFGPMVDRDFSSKTEINNETSLLLYFGMQLNNGYTYLGLGPILYTVGNHIYVNSVHTPDGTGNDLVSEAVVSNQNIWGGAAQVGYNYYFTPTCFMNLSYTYTRSGTYHFDNSINAAVYNGSNIPGPINLNLNRSISITTQEIMFSINKAF